MGLSARQVLRSLARPDKHYLGGGGPLLWAPPRPQHLDQPGFVDRVHYFGHALDSPLRRVILDEQGQPIQWQLLRREWQPGVLKLDYAGPDGIALREDRAVTPRGTLVSVLSIDAPGRVLFIWSHYPPGGHQTALLDSGQIWSWRELERPGVPSLIVYGVLAAREFEDAPHKHTVGLTLAPDLETARQNWTVDLKGDPLALAQAGWRAFFKSVPSFTCDDPYLEKAYWYRWYGLYLNKLPGGVHPAYPFPTVGEGIDYFRAPISYSAPCHVRELRWYPDPDWARGVFQTFLHHQRPDGSFPGHIFATGTRPERFYHADWGGAALALEQCQPDPAFRAELVEGLSRYADYLATVRDPDGEGLVEVWNHFETGQEYSPRYLFVAPESLEATWGQPFRLQGIDASVYRYQLERALGILTGGETRAAWQARARRTRQAILDKLWDPDAQWFGDRDPASGRRSPVRAAVGFYPFLTDIAGPEHLPALLSLLDPGEFWTPYPGPSLSVADPRFSAEGIWEGARRACPWNGRVWPMTSSHLADALAQASRTAPPALRVRGESLDTVAAEFIRRTIRMLFWEGDPARPNCFEHYNPYTGAPSAFRGIDDYQHSWIVDLIIRHVCGLQPSDQGALRVLPLSFGLRRCQLEGVPWRGRRITVTWNARGSGPRVYVDGKRWADPTRRLIQSDS